MKKNFWIIFFVLVFPLAVFAIPTREIVFIKIDSFIQKHKTDPLLISLRSTSPEKGLKIDCMTTEKSCPSETGVYWNYQSSDENELRLHFKFKKIESLTLKDFKREFDFASFHAGLPELKTQGWIVRQLESDDNEKENKVEFTDFSNGILKGKITTQVGVIDAALAKLPPECATGSRKSLQCGKNFEAHIPTEITFELSVEQKAVFR